VFASCIEVKEFKDSEDAGAATSRSSRKPMEPIPRGPLDPWGSITMYLGYTNVCESVRKEAIERQTMTIIMRSGLHLVGFAENPHFQDLVELLSPAYAKCGNAYPGDMLILVIVSSFCY